MKISIKQAKDILSSTGGNISEVISKELNINIRENDLKECLLDFGIDDHIMETFDFIEKCENQNNKVKFRKENIYYVMEYPHQDPKYYFLLPSVVSEENIFIDLENVICQNYFDSVSFNDHEIPSIKTIKRRLKDLISETEKIKRIFSNKN